MLLAMEPLAQAGFDFGDLIYLVFIVLAVLGGLGKQIRDHYQKTKNAPKQGGATAPPPPPIPQARKSAGLPQKTGRLDPSQAEVILAELFDLPTGRPRRQSSQPSRQQLSGPQPPPLPPLPQQGEAARPAPPQANRSEGGRPQGRRPKGPRPARAQPPQAAQVRQSQPSQKAQPTPTPGAPQEGAAARAADTPSGVVAVAPIPGMAVMELRRAIIMNEILAPPVALRGGPRSF